MSCMAARFPVPAPDPWPRHPVTAVDGVGDLPRGCQFEFGRHGGDDEPVGARLKEERFVGRDRAAGVVPGLAVVLVGEHGANLLDVEHLREGFDLHVRESAVQLVVETRGGEHAAQVLAAVRAAGYEEPRAIR